MIRIAIAFRFLGISSPDPCLYSANTTPRPGIVKEYAFEKLCQIIEAVVAHQRIVRVYLYGSRARGNNTEGSDYNFCILTTDDYGLFEIGGFYADLRDALGTDIDILYEEYLRDGLAWRFSGTGGCPMKHDLENIDAILEHCDRILDQGHVRCRHRRHNKRRITPRSSEIYRVRRRERERVKRPFADVTSRFKDVDWHEICKIHDFMAHQYEEIDSEFQWSTMKNNSRPPSSTVRRLWRHSNRNPMVDDSPVTESYPVPNINIRFRPMQLFAACLVHRSETSSSDSNPLSLV